MHKLSVVRMSWWAPTLPLKEWEVRCTCSYVQLFTNKVAAKRNKKEHIAFHRELRHDPFLGC